MERHTSQVVDQTLLVHDLHHVVDEILLRLLLTLLHVRLLLLSALHSRTRLDHCVYDGRERLHLYVLVIRLGQLDGARKGLLHLVNERRLRLEAMIARGERYDQQAAQRRTVLVAECLICGEQVVEHERQSVAVLAATWSAHHHFVLVLLGAAIIKVNRFVHVLRDDLGAAGIRANKFT